MFVPNLFFQILLHVLLFLLLNIVYGRISYQRRAVQLAKLMPSPFLPPDLKFFLLDLKKLFKRHFPQDKPKKCKPGRPRLYRLPFFLVWAWNRVYFKQDTETTLEKVNNCPKLRQMFEIPSEGLKQTTYDDFTAKELQNYLETLTKEAIHELYHKKLVRLNVTALDDLPLKSRLNLSKCIDFVQPTQEAITKVFQTLGEWTDLLDRIGDPPNTQRSWSDYLKLYLLYVLWGFPSKESFDEFLRATPNIGKALQLDRKRVLSATLFKYINRLEDLKQAKEVFDKLLKVVLAWPAVKDRRIKNKPLMELGMLHGILGNPHALKDYGARLHYNSSKGKYYFGRIARIIIDTWSQIPLWITVTSASQPLVKDLEEFGKKVTSVLPARVRPVLLLADQGFRGTLRVEALRRGFVTIKTILLTPAYNRANPQPNIFRKERLAVERTIGHLAVHLELEHPRQLGEQAALNWTLGTVFLMQRIALYNHTYHPHRSSIAIRYLQR